MPLYDFKCRSCGREFEAMAAMEAGDGLCVCGGSAARQVSVATAYRADADWLESVVAVVEKDSSKPHVRAFLAEPSRANYRGWMRGEGIRPMENGEFRRPTVASEVVRREVMQRFAARSGRA